eukprot:CAMPEP_0204578818 /NCGR_PEP_ID=MMETSP0661-20131031/43149_1 /ASSEMBLY_ACC=CAM_ASM_000606 /TAXON_ID=109239 /ORGANISM="Alexandrium margalefi, Strain AMGDE01CS-322" /LENGTH=110 /DNA_ID=CAMNT_0051587783 /DNA_START=372 /DNA_END=701 /DNA_ORIENTATION=-
MAVTNHCTSLLSLLPVLACRKHGASSSAGTGTVSAPQRHSQVSQLQLENQEKFAPAVAGLHVAPQDATQATKGSKLEQRSSAPAAGTGAHAASSGRASRARREPMAAGRG